MEILTLSKDDYTITTDKNKLDIIAIHDFLSNHSHWSRNIPIETVKTSIDNSLNFGLFHFQKQIGYAKIISDYSTIAYLGDVYVLPDYRGNGLSKWLMQQVMSHPNLQGLRRWILLTVDAHGLYKQYGWEEPKNPERYMELYNPNVYSDNK
jgi:GNAT superfamily N-acetyltransferase